MLFSHLGRLAAWLLLFYSLLRIVLAVTLVQTGEPNPELYLGRLGTGEVIDQSLSQIGWALALGIIAEISFGMRAKN